MMRKTNHIFIAYNYETHETALCRTVPELAEKIGTVGDDVREIINWRRRQSDVMRWKQWKVFEKENALQFLDFLQQYQEQLFKDLESISYMKVKVDLHLEKQESHEEE